VAEDLDQVLALKASAKSARDDEDWDGAIGDLQEAIEFLRDHMAESSQPVPSWLAAEFADTYGLIGGIQRRWGLRLDGEDRRRHLEASVTAYDEGFSYERDLQPNEANTYNRVNRLVSRVLLDTRVLQKDGDAAFEVADELQRAEEILTEETESVRQRDPWAYCDLGTVRLLRGMPNALSAFHQLDRLRPPAFVYDSALATLQPLCDVASGIRPDLAQAIAQLRRSARYSE
jgi:tetratricopeptide (TPR) repeat protein